MGQLGLNAVRNVLRDDERLDECVATAESERDRVAWRDPAEHHANGARLGCPIHFQTDRAATAVDERHLARRIRQVGVLRIAWLHCVRWTAPADKYNVAGEARNNRSPADRFGVKIMSGN